MDKEKIRKHGRKGRREGNRCNKLGNDKMKK